MQAVFSRVSRRLPLALLAAAVAGLTGAGVASAATYTVNTTTDSATPCAGSGTCSLRGAVIAADNAGGSSTINVPAGLYKLTIPSAAADDPTTGDLDINSKSNNATVTINGAGSDSTILSGNNIDRLFAVQQGGSLTLSGMTLRQGYPSSNSSGYGEGGAIYTDGGLTVASDVVFQDNQAESDFGGALGTDTSSAVSLTGATFENNKAYLGSAIGDGSNQTLTVRKSSFLGNGSSSTGAGGAIFSASGPTSGGGLNVDSSTFTANSAFEGGAILWYTGSAVSVTHSTFNGNSAIVDGGAISDGFSSGMALDYDSFTNNSASGLCFFFGAGVRDAKTLNSKRKLSMPHQIPGNICGGGGALSLISSSSNPSYAVAHDLFKGNNSDSGIGGAILWGGGTLSSSASTYADNDSGAAGGAIFADSEIAPNSLTLINDTLSHNGGNNIPGGALYVQYFGTPGSLVNDTITANVGYPGAGIYGTSDLTTSGYSGTGPAGIENTVIADNNGGDCDAQFTSFDLGHNMDSDGSCFSTSTQSSDHPNTEPRLGNPADNGGPLVGNQTDGSAVIIPTDAETSISPTVNSGTNSGCPATDERGVTRPQGGICDIGAFELSAAKLKVTKIAPESVGLHSLFTYKIKVSNSGPGFSTGTTLVDKIPSSETLKDVIANPGGSCTHSGRTVTCKLGDLRNGGSATVKIVVKVNRTGKVTNTARATNAQGSKASGHATTKVHAVKAARAKRTAPKFTG